MAVPAARRRRAAALASVIAITTGAALTRVARPAAVARRSRGLISRLLLLLQLFRSACERVIDAVVLVRRSLVLGAVVRSCRGLGCRERRLPRLLLWLLVVVRRELVAAWA